MPSLNLLGVFFFMMEKNHGVCMVNSEVYTLIKTKQNHMMRSQLNLSHGPFDYL